MNIHYVETGHQVLYDNDVLILEVYDNDEYEYTEVTQYEKIHRRLIISTGHDEANIRVHKEEIHVETKYGDVSFEVV